MTVGKTASTDWAGVGFGVGLASLAALHLFKLPPVLPALIARYHYDHVLAGGFMSVYALAGIGLSLAVGRWIGRRGPRIAVWAALAGLFAGASIGLLAPESGQAMLAGRAVEGVGFAFAAIAGPAIALASASPRHSGLVIGAIAAWIPTGQLAATAMARLSLAADWWQGPWIAALAATALMAVWHARRRDRHQAASEATASRPGSTAAFPWPAMAVGAGVFMLWSGQYFAFMTWLPLYLVDVGGLAGPAAALAYALPVATLLACNLLTGLALRRRDRLGPLLVVGLAAQAVVWLAVPLAGGTAGAVALLLFYGIGAGITPTCLFALPGALAGANAARGFSVLMTGRNIGVFAGPLLLAWISSADWAVAVPVFGGTGAMAVLAGLWVARRLARPDQGTSR